MAEQTFCPRCGIRREGRTCAGCGYDFVEGAKTPAVTLSRGINPVSLVIGIAFLAVIAWILYTAWFA